MPTFQTSRGLVEYRFDERGRRCVLLFNGGHSNPGMRDSEQYFMDRDYGVISVARPGYCKTEQRIDKALVISNTRFVNCWIISELTLPICWASLPVVGQPCALLSYTRSDVLISYCSAASVFRNGQVSQQGCSRTLHLID